jgi:hypothetical protein
MSVRSERRERDMVSDKKIILNPFIISADGGCFGNRIKTHLPAGEGSRAEGRRKDEQGSVQNFDSVHPDELQNRERRPLWSHASALPLVHGARGHLKQIGECLAREPEAGAYLVADACSEKGKLSMMNRFLGKST